MNGHQLVLPLIITYIKRHNLMLMFSHNKVFSGVFLKSEILYIVQLCTGMSRIECVIVECVLGMFRLSVGLLCALLPYSL